MGGLSRRFLNLVMDNRINGVRSLRCIDITRQHFFNKTEETVAAGSQQRINKQVARDALKMDKIWLPNPSFSIRGCSTSSDPSDDQPMHFFLPIADRRVVCVDQLGHGVLLEADTGNVVIKSTPISTSPNRHPSPSLFPPLISSTTMAFASATTHFLSWKRFSNQLNHQAAAWTWRRRSSRRVISSRHLCTASPPQPTSSSLGSANLYRHCHMSITPTSSATACSHRSSAHMV